jgi:hypothetical protein
MAGDGLSPSEGARPAWPALVERERARGFASLGGSRAEIAIPVRQAFVDRLVARVLASRPSTELQVDLLEGARLGVTVSHRVLGFPVRARTVLELDREVDLVGQRLVLRHDDGALWTTIRTVAGTLGLVPAGVTFGAGTVEVDLRAMAARAGFGDLLPLLQHLAIHGPADGLFAIEAELAVSDTVGQGFSPADPPSVGQGFSPADPPSVGQGFSPADPPSVGQGFSPAPSSLRQSLADLAGSRARVHLRVHESLVNEVLTLARTVTAGPAGGEHSSPSWTSFVHDARVRFVEGRLVLWLDVELPADDAGGEERPTEA